MLGIDPKQLAQAKEIGKHVVAVIQVSKPAGSFTLILTAVDSEGTRYVEDLVNRMSTNLAGQLSSFFGIKGTISEIK